MDGYGGRHADPRRITVDSQANLVAGCIEQVSRKDKVVLAGHSVGGVIAAAAARGQPERILALVNVEGNFTLSDAFWTSQVARRRPDEVASALEADRSDSAAWLERAGVRPGREAFDPPVASSRN
jgi:lipase